MNLATIYIHVCVTGRHASSSCEIYPHGLRAVAVVHWLAQQIVSGRPGRGGELQRQKRLLSLQGNFQTIFPHTSETLRRVKSLPVHGLPHRGGHTGVINLPDLAAADVPRRTCMQTGTPWPNCTLSRQASGWQAASSPSASAPPIWPAGSRGRCSWREQASRPAANCLSFCLDREQTVCDDTPQSWSNARTHQRKIKAYLHFPESLGRITGFFATKWEPETPKKTQIDVNNLELIVFWSYYIRTAITCIHERTSVHQSVSASY